jgi:predicted membrane-bound mannosyltransferase
MLIELLAHAHDETSRALDVFRSFLMRQRLHTWLVGRDLWRALSVAHMVVDAFST